MKETKHSPLPWTADIGDRLSDGSDCWEINSPTESIAEMMCPKDIEKANAEFIVRCVNAHEALVDALKTAMPIIASHMAMTGGDVRGLGGSFQDRLVFDKCEDALKLAEGESNEPTKP